jgi:hypothetical protein
MTNIQVITEVNTALAGTTFEADVSIDGSEVFFEVFDTVSGDWLGTFDEAELRHFAFSL